MNARGLLLLLTLALPGVATAQAARVTDLRYPPLPPFEIARPERVVLDNGLVVILLEDHELPLVEATALVRGGTRVDPPGKAGLADLAATVLRAGGTERMTGDALDLWLESRAAAIETTAQEDAIRITLSALAQDFPEALRVYADVLRRPAFDAARLEVARTQAVSDITRQNDEPDNILLRELRKTLYGADSPYAAVPTLAGLRALGREDLIAWHRRTFQPNQIVLGLVGDFRRDETLRLLREAFGDWPRGPADPAAEIPYRKTPNPGVFWARKDDIAQSYLMIGHLGIRSDDPDLYAVEVLNQVLSGSFASRLLSEVRTRKGLAYSVDGRVVDDWDHPGITYLYASTKVASTGACLQALLDEARGLQTRPPTAEEVEKAKQALLGSFIFSVDSKREVLGQVLTYELFGYPLDRLARYRAGIEAVTLDQVRAAAVRHLRPEDFSFIVVGPAEGRDRPLTDFGPVTPLDVTIEAPEPED